MTTPARCASVQVAPVKRHWTKDTLSNLPQNIQKLDDNSETFVSKPFINFILVIYFEYTTSISMSSVSFQKYEM